jgi:hypothetical protein
VSARGFGSVAMASGVVVAALGCYLVSLKVASERAKLESVETQIVLAERDIRVLETEIGTRGRLAQLERWNVNFIRLSAPSADQILEGGFQLATLVKPPEKTVVDAPVVLASAPAPEKDDRLVDDAGAPIAVALAKSQRADEMMHVADYKVPERAAIDTPKTATPADKKPLTVAPKPAASTKGAKVAAADPLAPLPKAKTSATHAADATASKPAAKPKETGSRQ